jgi:hypothetical protein
MSVRTEILWNAMEDGSEDQAKAMLKDYVTQHACLICLGCPPNVSVANCDAYFYASDNVEDGQDGDRYLVVGYGPKGFLHRKWVTPQSFDKAKERFDGV